LLRLSSSLLRIQKVGRAKKVLLRAAKMNLPDPMIYLNLGSIEARAGNPLVAKTYFMQALQFAEEQGNDAIQAAAKNYLKKLAEL
jgi:Flp pilus assembly protein TadD